MVVVDELIDVVDDQDKVVGTAHRAEIRRRNLLHRAVAVLVRNGRGDVLVHRRTKIKDVFPGLYDAFVSGTVEHGETYEQCAIRELREEVGVMKPKPTPRFVYRYEGPQSRTFTKVFDLTSDEALRFQEHEIAWAEFVPAQEIHQALKQWDFVPDGEEIFTVYLDRVGL